MRVPTLVVLVALSSVVLGDLSSAQAEDRSRGEGRAVMIESPHLLTPLFKSLSERERGVGLTRITHIGDSHIIADFWTGVMRARLQRRFGDGGRGFVLGGKMWRSYSQRDIRHKTEGEWEITTLKRGRDLGVFGPGGAALSCSRGCPDCPERDRERREPCSTSVRTVEGKRAARFDTLDVYTLGHGQGGRFKISVDGRPKRSRNTFSPWMTVQRHRFSLRSSSHEVTFEPHGDQGETWLFGFSLMNSAGGLIYDSIGLNGAQAQHLLKNNDANLRRAFELLDPTLMILSFGVNEVFDRSYERDRYYSALSYVLAALRNPKPNSHVHERPCLLTGPFATIKGGVESRELDEVYAIQRELAAAYRCAFWDARSAMGGSMRAWQRAKLGRRDGVHLNRHGYRRVAQLFEESLIMTWDAWRAHPSSQPSGESSHQMSQTSTLSPSP